MKRVIIFGGDGFIGSYIVKELAAAGHVITIFSRNVNKANRLKLCGNLGQITPVCGDALNEAGIEKNIKDQDIAINLVGILSETKKCKFRDINYTAAKLIAEKSKNAGVKRLIHFSALVNRNGDDSEYIKTKLDAESAVKSIFSDAIILRPSIVFGKEDKFFNLFAKIAKMFRIIPLIENGKALLQPVYVGDIARLVKIIVENPEIKSESYDLVGHKVYSLKDIMRFVIDTLNIKCLLITIPYRLALIKAWFLEFSIMSPLNKFITGFADPILTREQVRMLKYDSTSQSEIFKEFGITTKSIEEVVPQYFVNYK